MKEIQKTKKPDYGNWVSQQIFTCFHRVMFIVGGFFAITWLPLPCFKKEGSRLMLVLRVALATLFGGLTLVRFYFKKMHHAFSPSGGNLSNEILDRMLLFAKIDDPKKVLDIGCGSGALTIKAAKRWPNAEVVGVDCWDGRFDFELEQCRRNAMCESVGDQVRFQKGDASALEFPDESFDVVLSNFVFHEVRSVKDKKRLIDEGLRVLKPGGVFVFHDLFLQKYYYGDADILKAYLNRLAVTNIVLKPSLEIMDIPRFLCLPIAFGKNIALIYGKK